jgi:glutamyl-tRNA(Gln) amidotransferase subunit E
MNGRLPFRGRELSITQVTVEEDSCREVSDVGHLVVWRTDRLGTPLIETVTGPDLRTPEEVEEAILLVGRVCRGTGHVRVGIGASRQDVNVSVRGGRRVEIKGVPQAWWARGLVHGEAVRQVNLLRLRDRLADRGLAREEQIEVGSADVTAALARSAFPWFREDHVARVLEARRPGLERGEGRFCVRAVRLAGLRGVLSFPGQPGLRFDHELAGRIRVIAGIDHGPVLVHDEAWPAYEGAAAELAGLRDVLRCREGDALAVVVGAEADTLTAEAEIRIRLVEALDGVPSETRQPHRDGHTGFERILPGPDRMYPDTDSPPHRVTAARVEALRAALPDPPWVREARWSAAGVPASTVHYLIRRGGAARVDAVVEDGADVRLACFFFGERVKGLARAGVPVQAIPDRAWRALFRAFRARPVLLEAWKPLLRALAAEPAADPLDLAARLGLGEDPRGWTEAVTRVARDTRPDHPDGTVDQRVRFLMGRLMRDLRGRVPAALVLQEVTSVF